MMFCSLISIPNLYLQKWTPWKASNKRLNSQHHLLLFIFTEQISRNWHTINSMWQFTSQQQTDRHKPRDILYLRQQTVSVQFNVELQRHVDYSIISTCNFTHKPTEQRHVSSAITQEDISNKDNSNLFCINNNNSNETEHESEIRSYIK
jgi:hypothetical protein